MFKRNSNRTITIQDDSVKNPYDPNSFVEKMNSVVFLYNNKPGSPANFYQNALMVNADAYNEYLALTREISEQFLGLTGRLKNAQLPTLLPDAKLFIDNFERIKNYNDNDFREAMTKEAILLMNTLKICIEANKKCAINNGIPIEPIKSFIKDKSF